MSKPNRRGGSDGAEGPSGYERGLSLLARREHSVRELQRKLAAKGHAPAEAGAAIERLREAHYQDDDRFAASLARRRAAQGYGPRRILAELKSHGLGDAAIRVVIAGLDVDWDTLAADQLRRRHGGRGSVDAAERAARAGFLLRRGFDPATVRAVTRAEVDGTGEEFEG